MAVLRFVYAFLMGTSISFELRTSSPATILSRSRLGVGGDPPPNKRGQQTNGEAVTREETLTSALPRTRSDSWRHSHAAELAPTALQATALSWFSAVIVASISPPTHEFVVAASPLSSRAAETGSRSSSRPSVLGCSAIHGLSRRKVLQAVGEMCTTSNSPFEISSQNVKL